jgi:PBP1b-binding outer membrane lipoprotein LpoB
MEEGGLNMKGVYILLLVLVIASLTLGCVGKNAPETKASVTPVQTTASPAQTDALPAGTPAQGTDDFGTESDITAIDSLVNDSNLDISLSDVTI